MPMTYDEKRAGCIRQMLVNTRLDGLICLLPENLVLLAGYWPVIGHAAVIYPREGDPVIVAPVLDERALERATVRDVRTFPVFKLDAPPPPESLARMVADVLQEKGLAGRRLGFDGTFGDISPTQKVLEPWVPSGETWALLRRASGGAEWIDISPHLAEQRICKTEFEIERIRIACEIADFGLRAFREGVEEGKRETDLAADIEAAIMREGTGYKGTLHARGQAFVFSGVERLYRHGWGVAPNTDRRLQPGDLVMVELSVVADGYFADLARMRVVGKATEAQREAYEACVAAQEAALAVIRRGVAAGEVDRAARDVFRRRGLGQAFVHLTGHGVGFRYHDGPPFLLPGVETPLDIGMVHSVEPGIYTPDLGGLRLEDDVVVTETGHEVLSKAPRDLEG
ncbi:MAG: aminopeptidase P family protein [Firmicutes bacterium]|nr:aminopeptidase P family protein [Bacillota bacterium]